MQDLDLRSRLLAILAADAVGYSRLMSLDGRGTVAALDRARAVFRTQIAAHGGRLIDTAGDSVLAAFDSASGAVGTAIAAQRELAAFAAEVAAERRMRFRIGVHLGDVIEKNDGTVYGDGVNIAARLEGLAPPGTVTASTAVRSALARQLDVVFEDLGERQVKNIAEPVRVFRVRERAPGEPMAPVDPVGEWIAAPLGNLPATPPQLFGRQKDMDALVALMRAHPLVSIVGPGGIGKTRLSQAVAHALRGDFADGVWICELASIGDPGLLAAAVAQTLGVRLSGRQAAHEEVMQALRDRSLLLVLDNCEHVVDAASAFAQALDTQVPGARLLATTQILLRTDAEQVFRVPTLEVPQASADVDEAAATGAVALLLSRVRGRMPAFALDARNVADVVDICRRLDGMPLAIELAAARVPLLGVTGVRERLHERLRMLTGGARTAARRHQTLRATLEWSHGLLADDERTVFRRAGVFVGSFTMAAAQLTLAGGPLDEWAVLEQIGALVDKSMIVPSESEPPRYHLLESTRAFALEKLREAGELDATRERHARAMVHSFGSAGEDWTATRAALLERQLPDLDNLRAALDWAESGDPILHAELAAAGLWIWGSADQRVEGLRRGAAALARVSPAMPAAIEAHLQGAWAGLATREAGPRPRLAAERAVALYRGLGDKRGLYRSLGTLAWAAALGGDVEAGARAAAEMADLVQPDWPLGARWWEVVARCYVTYLGGPAQLDSVRVQVDDMMRLAVARGDADNVRIALMWQELTAQARGDFAVAVRLGREVVARARQDRFGSADLTNCIGNLAMALIQAGELDEAIVTAREAARLSSVGGQLWQMLDPMALLACKRGRLRDAAKVLGRAEAVNRWRGGNRELVEQRTRDQAMAMLGTAMTGQDLERLMKEGEAMSDEEAARLAVAD